MPQTYIRAVDAGAVGRTSPVAVSYSRNGGADPGTEGNKVGDQDCITTNYALWPVPALQTTSVTPRAARRTASRWAVGLAHGWRGMYRGCGTGTQVVALAHGVAGWHTGRGADTQMVAPAHRCSRRHTGRGADTPTSDVAHALEHV